MGVAYKDVYVRLGCASVARYPDALLESIYRENAKCHFNTSNYTDGTVEGLLSNVNFVQISWLMFNVKKQAKGLKKKYFNQFDFLRICFLLFFKSMFRKGCMIYIQQCGIQ